MEARPPLTRRRPDLNMTIMARTTLVIIHHPDLSMMTITRDMPIRITRNRLKKSGRLYLKNALSCLRHLLGVIRRLDSN